MKITLPISLLAIAAMAVTTTGCSSDGNDEPRVADKEAISFANPFINNSVRQKAATTLDNLDEFRVWGFVNEPTSLIFDGNKVVKGSSGWTVDRTEYWYPNNNYYFTGIAPASPTVVEFTPATTAVAAGEQYYGGGTIAFNNKSASGRDDLVYAFQSMRTPAQLGVMQPVQMTFSHLLSQISFAFKNEVSKATVLEIQNLRVNGVMAQGAIDMTQANPSWTPAEFEGLYGVMDISGIKADGTFGINATKESDPVFIIPENAGYNMQFNIVVRNGSQVMATYFHDLKLPTVNFARGNSYRFVTTLTGENINPDAALQPITFTVESVSDWIQTPDQPVN